MCPEAAGCRGQGPARGQRRGSATRAQPDRARLGRLLPQRGVHQTFHKLDGYGWTLLYRWALFRHPDKPKRWVIDRYFGQFHPTRHDRWVFGNRDSGAYLHRFAWTPIVRHDLVKGAASPDDPALATFWAQRRRKAVPPPINLTVLLAEQPQDGQIDRRGYCLASPLGPVGGQGGVVGGRRAFDQVVPDDRCPGEPVQVGTAVAVAEHPPVVPGRVELAEVAVDDPPFRLVRVAKQCPPVEQGPPVAVQLVERLGGHHAAVEGRELAR